jgi:hypothetical protein
MYSFDNGKTYQGAGFLILREPGPFSYNVVVKNDKNKTSKAFPKKGDLKKEDFCKCFPYDLICKPDTPPPPPPCPPPQIISCYPTDETVRSRNDGKIIIHSLYGCKPIQYSIDTGNTYQSDSVFKKLKPGRYRAQVMDSLTILATYFEPIIIKTPPPPPPCGAPPTKAEVEKKLNDLFMDPNNNKALESVNKLFASQSMNVDCELIGIPAGTKYQLFQFLQRRHEGKPGSKKIEVQGMKCNNKCQVISIQIREIPVKN